MKYCSHCQKLVNTKITKDDWDDSNNTVTEECEKCGCLVCRYLEEK